MKTKLAVLLISSGKTEVSPVPSKTFSLVSVYVEFSVFYHELRSIMAR